MNDRRLLRLATPAPLESSCHVPYATNDRRSTPEPQASACAAQQRKIRIQSAFRGVLLLAAVLLPGCASPGMSLEKMKAMMPERSPELDKLNMLAGDWTTEGQVQFIGMDEPIHTTGTSHAQWECDGRFLMDHSDYDMGPLGPLRGVSMWGWDSQRKRFAFSWFDGFGESATGTARYDESAKTWHIKTRGQSTRCNVKNRGTIRVVDENTLEWTWEQWSAWGFPKYADMKGVSRRK